MLELLLPRKRMAAVVEGLARQFATERDLTLQEDDLFEAFAAFCVVRQYQRDIDPIDLRAGGPCDLGIDGYAVLTALSLALPSTVKSKPAIQLYIAENVIRDRSRWRLD